MLSLSQELTRVPQDLSREYHNMQCYMVTQTGLLEVSDLQVSI